MTVHLMLSLRRRRKVLFTLSSSIYHVGIIKIEWSKINFKGGDLL